MEKVGKYTNDNLPETSDDFLQFSYDGKTFAGDMHVGLVNNAYSLPQPYGVDAVFGEIEVDIKLVKIENGQETDIKSNSEKKLVLNSVFKLESNKCPQINNLCLDESRCVRYNKCVYYERYGQKIGNQ